VCGSFAIAPIPLYYHLDLSVIAPLTLRGVLADKDKSGVEAEAETVDLIRGDQIGHARHLAKRDVGMVYFWRFLSRELFHFAEASAPLA
jgi:hypothetical protein